MNGTIRYLKIANYRSIDMLELHNIKPFSVFAGPNGSGKSNFFDALDFVNGVVLFGADEALKQHGGFENIR
jgi:AAA15 family ATPase/GTPase